MNRYFYCYSYNLKEFLKSNGLRYVAASVNSNTQKKFWVFEGTNELNRLLSVWSSKKL